MPMHCNASPRRRVLTTLSAALLAVACVPVAAQDAYPDRPITLIVPNAAGGAADNLARSMAEELGKRLGQAVIVENIGGLLGRLAHSACCAARQTATPSCSAPPATWW